MPNYDELIQKSQENVKILSVKLKDLDKLHEDIKELLKQPELLGDKFQETVDLSKKYIDSIEDSAKKYLDGNNFLFTEKIKELDEKLEELRKELDRLAAIDLEENFKNLQKTLSEIFNAVNNINLTLSSITQTLTAITQSLGDIQNAIDIHHREITGKISSFQSETSTRLNDQDVIATDRFESIEAKLEYLIKQNILLNKGLKINRIFQICAGVILVILLGFALLKLI